MSKRALLAKTFDRIGLWRGILEARKVGVWPWSGLTVVLYHRVLDLDAASLQGLDVDLVDATPADFDAQMAFFKKHFTPVGLAEVEAAAAGEKPLPPDALLVSFDDGYRDNVVNALPILVRHGMKAVFFLSTSHITERRLFWWEKISLFIREAKKPRIELTFPSPLTLEIADDRQRAASTRRLNSLVKDHYALDLPRFLEELAAACGVTWSDDREHALADKILMTWEEARTLIDAGMAVGSHTVRHRVLQTLTPDQVDEELRVSREEIERRMGVPIRSIAYPVGRPIAARPQIRESLKKAGYLVGFTARPGLNPLRAGDDLFDLHRLPMDRGTAMSLTRANLALPWLAS